MCIFVLSKKTVPCSSPVLFLLLTFLLDVVLLLFVLLEERLELGIAVDSGVLVCILVALFRLPRRQTDFERGHSLLLLDDGGRLLYSAAPEFNSFIIFLLVIFQQRLKTTQVCIICAFQLVNLLYTYFPGFLTAICLPCLANSSWNSLYLTWMSG